MPLTLTILSAPRSRRRSAASRSAPGAGSAASRSRSARVVGGAVVDGISWQWIFWLNVPIGLVLIPLALIAPAGDLRARRQARPARPRARQRRPVRDRLGPGPRQRPGLGRARRSSARSPSAPCSSPRSSPGSCARAAPMLPMRFFRKPRVRARERRLAVHVLRDVRLDLPALAVLPDRAGLLAARLRAADPAVDARADVHRPDRRRALRPDRRQDARRRSGSRCRRSRSAWIGHRLDADRRPTPS